MSESADMVKAPFTDEQVNNLNAYQRVGIMHPFTCGDSDCRADLVATSAGWVCPKCDYTQDWAHAFMANGYIDHLKEFVRVGGDKSFYAHSIRESLKRAGIPFEA